MHKRSGFIVGLATAAVTFGCLWFTLGPAHFNRGHRMCHPMERHCIMKEEREDDECCEQAKKHDCEKTIVIKKIIKTDSVKK